MWVGVDLGKQTHHACAIDRGGKAVFQQRLGSDRAGVIEQLIDRAGKVASLVQ